MDGRQFIEEIKGRGSTVTLSLFLSRILTLNDYGTLGQFAMDIP